MSRTGLSTTGLGCLPAADSRDPRHSSEEETGLEGNRRESGSDSRDRDRIERTDGPTDVIETSDRPDDALASSVRDRQILVVGRTVAGLALGALLERGGYDPLVLPNGEPPRASRVSILWPSSLDVIDRVGVDSVAFDGGRAIDSATVRVEGERVRTLDVDRSDRSGGPVVASTGRLRERLAEAAPDGPAGRDVTAIEDHDGSLEVTFDDGVREWFDAVIGADGPASSIRAVRGDQSDPLQFDQFELVVTWGRDRTVDAWTDRGLAQIQPLPRDGDALVRLTTAGDEGRDRPVRRELAAVESGPLSEIDGGDVVDGEYARVRQADGPDWEGGQGRVAYCGASALPLAPATGLRAALALEDAWVLADELARGSRSVEDAVRTYASRRERRIGRLLSDVEPTPPGGTGPTAPALAALGRFRAAALRRMDMDDPGASSPVPRG